MKRTTPLARVFTRTLAPLALAGVVMAACGNSSSTSTSSTIALSPRVVVTSVKDDPKSELLAAIYARVLEDAGFRVSRKDPVALDRAGYYAAIQAGDFQLIPDFSGELLKFVYDQPNAPVAPTTLAPPSGPASTEVAVTIPPTTTIASLTGTTVPGDTGVSTSAAPATTEAPTTTAGESTTTTIFTVSSNGRSVTEQLVAIKAALPSTLSVNDGLLAEDKQVIACTPATLKAHESNQFITLTNLASLAPDIRIGGSAAFMADAEFGMPALIDHYGGDFKGTVTVEEADMGGAIDNGDAECFAMNSMNPLITTKRMTVLIDDKVMVPSNAAIALLASGIATPDLIAAIDTLSASLTTERLNQMLNEVVANGTNPTVVANAFMDSI
jgi:glycine betaine/choline ABC-type transport system substrate-binding protein